MHSLLQLSQSEGGIQLSLFLRTGDRWRSVSLMTEPQMPAWDDVREAQPGRSRTADAARPADTERIKVALKAAQETFEDDGMAAEWLESPCPALGGAVPLQMLGTGAGLDEVLRELVRICYGLPP